MSARSMIRAVAAFAVTLAAAEMARGADEWFVDAKNGQDGAGRGTSEATAFLSVQAAVDAAAAGDTITLLPGDYTEGLTAHATYGRSRVVIDKKLTLRSKNGRASRDTTRIVGAWDTTESSSYPYGMGPNRIRCVCVLESGEGSTFEGITFYRGVASHNGSNDHGGGGLFVANNKAATAIDCAFRECQARNGGGMCSMSASSGCVAVRCLFKRNRTYKFAAAFRGGNCYNCVFDDNDYTRKADGTKMADGSADNAGATDYAGKMINCTYVGSANKGAGDSNHSAVRNCTFVYCRNGAMGATVKTYSHCVSHDDDRTNNASATAYIDRCELFSPYDEDYRLVKDAKSLTTGSLDDLALMPEQYRDTDYYGNPRVTGGVVYCGAVQGKLDVPSSGFYLTCEPTVGQWLKDGEPMNVNFRTIMQKEGYRNAFNVQFAATNGAALLRYKLGDSWYWPMPDDSVWAVNPGWGGVKQLSTLTDTHVLWVDATAAAEGADGTATKPFATIQAAVDAAVAAKAPAVIRVKKGDYATGETTLHGLKSRVAIPADYAKVMRIVAVDGAEQTFITGAEDPAGAEASWKLGANAVRCVAAACTNGTVAIHGFTLRGGRTDMSGDNSASRGGGLCSRDANGNPIANVQVVDCVITNCAAKYGSAVYGGTMYRCRAIGCLGMDGALRSAWAYSSLFTKTARYNNDSRVIGAWVNVYNCTVADNNAIGVSAKVSHVLNSVLGWNGLANTPCDIASALQSTDAMKYTLYQAVASSVHATCTEENPVLFADMTNGDLTLLGSSKGQTRAYVANQSYPILDVDGKPYQINDDGTCVAGAFRAADVSDKTYYVDPVGGNDANDGLSESAAFRTLARSMQGVLSGDTVVALPGTYADGTMLQTLAQSRGRDSVVAAVEPSIPARVVVPSGVTLVSRDGAATTIIEGEANTRCAFVCKDATLRGFTVQHGDVLEVDVDGGARTPNTCGAGVCCFAGKAVTDEEFLGLVENCVIRDNTARMAAGGAHGTYRNCVFTGNKAKLWKPGAAVTYARVEGCFFAGNGMHYNTAQGHSVLYGCEVSNCTVMDQQADASGVILFEGTYKRPVVNTVVMSHYVGAPTMKNCVFGHAQLTNKYEFAASWENCVTGTVALAENGMPLKGSLVIDAGANGLVPEALAAAGDLAGVQRVMNGQVDVGAYEYDWRGDYSKALANRRVTVTDVPADATLDGQALTWADGEVTVEWASGGVNAAYRFAIDVAEGASLTVTVNGTVLGTYGPGAQTLKFDSALALNTLRFAATGEVAISAFDHKSGGAVIVR